MRILKRYIKKEEGYLVLVPTEEEDYWYIYNLISQGDIVRSCTHRKIQQESKIGVKNNIKRKINLTLKIVAINYYAGEFLQLSLKGRNCEENEYLKMGQYHTFNLELEEKITIIKKNWDSYHFKIIKDVSDPTHDSDVAAFIMDEGVAHLCYVKSSITLIKQKIEKNIPKKKSGAEQHEKQLEIFYKMCFEVLIKIDFELIKCLIIASPGFVKDDFFKFIKENFQKVEYLQLNKKHNIISKILLAKSSSGYLNSLNEILTVPAIESRLKDTKAVKEIKVLDEFYFAMSKDPDSVCYGQKHVFKAFQANAINVLMITDSLFRTKDLEIRKKFNSLVQSAKYKNVETHIFSSLHSSGEKLNSLTGIAAILKYSMPLEDEDEDENDIIEENFRTKIADRRVNLQEEDEDSDINLKDQQDILAMGFGDFGDEQEEMKEQEEECKE